MRGPRPIALAGIGAGLLCNYWILEAWLAERSDFAASWISDLATRTESTGWRFVALGVLAGLAVAGFALALLAADSRRPASPPHDLCNPVGYKGHEVTRGGGARWLRRGFWALFAAGAFAVFAGAAPLSCPEGIEPGCSLAYDPLDVVHSLATAGEIAATVLAFALVGAGLLQTSASGRRLPRPGLQARTGAWLTLGLGAVWGVVTVLTGVTYLGDALDSVKGALQRGDQVVFGAWLVLLGFAATPGARQV